MSDKHLTELGWKAFAKGKGLKDAALIKALAALEKAKSPGPEELAALVDIDEQVGQLRKALGNAPDGKDYLKELDGTLSKKLGAAKAWAATQAKAAAQKLIAADALAQAQAKAAAQNAKDDDEDSPAWLDPDLLGKQLKKCVADPGLKLGFAYADGEDKAPDVMVVTRKLMPKQLFDKVKIATKLKKGTCGMAWVAGIELILQLDTPMKGKTRDILKLVKDSGAKAITKVVLWSADGTVQEDEDTPSTGGATGARRAPPGGPAARLGTVEPKAISPELAAFKQRLAALSSLVVAAGDNPAAKQAKLLASQAGVASTKGEWAEVEEFMKQAEDLLAGVKPAAPGATPTAKAAATTTHTAPVSQKVAFTQTRLAWETTRNHVRAELQKLQAQMLADLKGDPAFANLSSTSNVLYRPLEKLDTRLMTELDKALNATTAEERNACHQRALKIVDEYMDFTRTDELLHDICDNGFIDLDIEKVLVARLTAMAAELKTAIAA